MRISTSIQAAEIVALRDLTPTVREFTLRLPVTVPNTTLVAASAWQPGAHLLVHITLSGQTTTRHYSLIPCPEPGCLRIAVKRLEPGRGGSQAMWRLQMGQSLTISAPLNHFPLDLNAPAYLLVAGGIGITPLMGMAQALCKRGADVRMVYAARSADEWAYQAELQALLGDRLLLVEGAGLDADAAVAQLPPGGQAYVCGPGGLLGAMRESWARAKRPEASLRFETFGNSGGQDAAFEVRLPRHDLSFEVQAGASLLDTLEQQGVQAIWGCRRGECGLCALPVLALDGDIEHRDVFFSEHEKQANTQMCVCVSRVRGCVTLDTAFRPDPFSDLSYQR